MNYLRIDGLVVLGPNGKLKTFLKSLDFEKQEAVLVDGTKVSPFTMYTTLGNFDGRLLLDFPPPNAEVSNPVWQKNN